MIKGVTDVLDANQKLAIAESALEWVAEELVNSGDTDLTLENRVAAMAEAMGAVQMTRRIIGFPDEAA